MQRINDPNLLHPRLLSALPGFIANYPEYVAPRFYLQLAETHRTADLQNHYYRQGTSRVDGYQITGRHQLNPSVAMDLVVYDDNGTPYDPRDDGPNWNRDNYLPIGIIASHFDLAWGGNWKTLFDGPHVELPLPAINYDLQMMTRRLHFGTGRVDGIRGPKTFAALDNACRMLLGSPYPGRLRPDLWRALWLACFGDVPEEWSGRYAELYEVCDRSWTR